MEEIYLAHPVLFKLTVCYMAGIVFMLLSWAMGSPEGIVGSKKDIIFSALIWPLFIPFSTLALIAKIFYLLNFISGIKFIIKIFKFMGIDDAKFIVKDKVVVE